MPVTVLSDFETTVLLMRKRELTEMRTEDARLKLKSSLAPEFEINASIDTGVEL